MYHKITPRQFEYLFRAVRPLCVDLRQNDWVNIPYACIVTISVRNLMVCVGDDSNDIMYGSLVYCVFLL